MAGRTKTGAALFLKAALAFAAAAATAFAPASAAAGPPAIQLLAPRDGAEMKAGGATVIGRSSAGKGAEVDVDVNGKAAPAVSTEAGGIFHSRVYLLPGKNVIRVVVGGNQATATVLATEREKYRYHPDVEKCVDCHAKWLKSYAVPGPKDLVCYKCHDRKDAGKTIHGPLGGGDCTACHDPHGSEHTALTRLTEESLCTTCHDQKSSAAHLKKSAGKSCTDCHDPHSANKAFLQK